MQLARTYRSFCTRVAAQVICAAALFLPWNDVWAGEPTSGPKFEVSFPASAHSQPITGRLFVMISRKDDPEVRLQVGWVTSPPTFGLDVNALKPGRAALIDEEIAGYPVRSLKDLPAGDYYVQALLNVYTEFHRADGHVIWAHMDQWEGQQFNLSPGNLYSKMQRVHLDASRKYPIKLDLSEVIPPVPVPADTRWIKHVKIQSKLLTAFWGQPIYLGAVVLLPRDYASHPDSQYPVIYEQGHFFQYVPFDFRTDDPPEKEADREWRKKIGVESGYEFYQAWASEHFPQVVAVTFQHPTPYNDDSYAVNSVNNGPYGDAILTELIPYLEAHFRIVREPYARVLTGGSTGGWEALALQLYHPDFFGGAWIFYPDAVDFRRYTLMNIYEDDNSFVADSRSIPEGAWSEWLPFERPIERIDDGQPIVTVRQLSRLEGVVGSKSRSGLFFDPYEAVYGPVGDDGYPKPLWDKTTGKIDHAVAQYMRDHDYDLRDYAQRHWTTLGPQLVGKLHFYCGEMDNFYLNLSVYLFEQFLQDTQNPHYAGAFEYGRPMKPHGWQPMTNAQLVERIASAIGRSAPQGSRILP